MSSMVLLAMIILAGAVGRLDCAERLYRGVVQPGKRWGHSWRGQFSLGLGAALGGASLLCWQSLPEVTQSLPMLGGLAMVVLGCWVEWRASRLQGRLTAR